MNMQAVPSDASSAPTGEQRPSVAQAGALGLGVAVLLLTLFIAQPLRLLPPYAAIALVFGVGIVTPGVIVASALLPRNELMVRVAAAPALSLGLMAVPGLVALEAHLSLRDFALMYSFVAAMACTVATLSRSRRNYEPPEITACELPADNPGANVLLLVLLSIAFAGVLSTPFWAADRLNGDFDDWTYASYVRDYLDTDNLNSEEPFFGTGEPVNPRMRSNIWVLSQALIADAAGASPLEVLQASFPPILTAFAVLVAYAFAKTLFYRTTIALLTGLFLVGHGLLDLSPYEGVGRNLYLRISEDKMAAVFLLFPVALVFAASALRKRTRASLVGFALSALALSFVHPMLLFYLGAVLMTYAVVEFVDEQKPATLITPLLLLLIVGTFSIWPFTQREQLADVTPSLFAFNDGSQFREQFRLVHLGGEWLVATHHVILHPLVLLSIPLTLLLFISARRSLTAKLLASMTFAALLMLYLPVLATPIARVMAPSTLWRAPWIIPVAPILAYVTFLTSQKIAAKFAWPRASAITAMAPACLLIATLSAALVVQEQYFRWDEGAFYDSSSSDSLLPGVNGSIFLGGLDRAFAGSWRLNERERLLLDQLEDDVPGGSTVAVESARLQLLIPTYLTDIYPTDSITRTIHPQDSDERRQVAVQEQTFAALYRGELTTEELTKAASTYLVTYIVTQAGTVAEVVMDDAVKIGAASAPSIVPGTNYRIYQMTDGS